MSVFQHFREHQWKALGNSYEPHRRVTNKIIAEDRASALRDAAQRRNAARNGDKVARHARYEALLSAYSLRGVWP